MSDTNPTSYCEAVRRGLPDPHRAYHDHPYGFPLSGDAALWGRLLVRNRLKVRAAITNAQRIVALRPAYGGFEGWLEAHHPLPLDAWLARFKATFTFVGGEIVREFLVSTGCLEGAHDADRPARARVLAARPP